MNPIALTREREVSLIAAAARDGAAYDAAIEAGVRPEDFADDMTRAAWRAVGGLRDEGATAIRPTDLKLRLSLDGAPDGAHALIPAIREAERSTAEQVESDAYFVRQAAEVRHLRDAFARAAEALAGPDLVAAARKAREIAVDVGMQADLASPSRGSRDIRGALAEIFNAIIDPKERARRIAGIRSGLGPLDHRTRGFLPGKIYTVAARPGGGKSAFGATVLANLVQEHAATGWMPEVLVYSLEMTKREVVERTLFARAGVPFDRAMFGPLPDEADMEALRRAGEAMHVAPIEVDEREEFTGGQMAADILRWHRRRWPSGPPRGSHGQIVPHGLVIIDYLQLVSGDDPKLDENRQITSVCRALRQVAKRTGLAIVMLAQLNRKADEEGRMPKLRDLRGSGSIEQDSYGVLFLHAVGEEQDLMAGRPWRGCVLMVLDKIRGGQKGIIATHFQGSTSKFSEWRPEVHGSYEELLAQAKPPPPKRRKKDDGPAAPPPAAKAA